MRERERESVCVCVSREFAPKSNQTNCFLIAQVNGAPQNELFRRVSGYVEQSDIHVSRITVREASLIFKYMDARIRLVGTYHEIHVQALNFSAVLRLVGYSARFVYFFFKKILFARGNVALLSLNLRAILFLVRVEYLSSRQQNRLA